MDDLIDRDFIKSLGGECIARRDKETGELIAITGIDLLPSAVSDSVKDLVTIFQNSKDMKLIARDGDLRADRIVTSALLTEDEAYQRGYEDGFREGRTRKELSEEKNHDQT